MFTSNKMPSAFTLQGPIFLGAKILKVMRYSSMDSSKLTHQGKSYADILKLNGNETQCVVKEEEFPALNRVQSPVLFAEDLTTVEAAVAIADGLVSSKDDKGADVSTRVDCAVVKGVETVGRSSLTSTGGDHSDVLYEDEAAIIVSALIDTIIANVTDVTHGSDLAPSFLAQDELDDVKTGKSKSRDIKGSKTVRMSKLEKISSFARKGPSFLGSKVISISKFINYENEVGKDAALKLPNKEHVDMAKPNQGTRYAFFKQEEFPALNGFQVTNFRRKLVPTKEKFISNGPLFPPIAEDLTVDGCPDATIKNKAADNTNTELYFTGPPVSPSKNLDFDSAVGSSPVLSRLTEGLAGDIDTADIIVNGTCGGDLSKEDNGVTITLEVDDNPAVHPSSNPFSSLSFSGGGELIEENRQFEDYAELDLFLLDAGEENYNNNIIDKEDVKSFFGNNYVTAGGLDLLLSMHSENLPSSKYKFVVVGTETVQFLAHQNADAAKTSLHQRYENSPEDNLQPCFIIPICLHQHWVLAVLRKKQGGSSKGFLGYIYDPLLHRERSEVENLMHSFANLLDDTIDRVRYLNGPNQTDGYNCGVFVYYFAKMFMNKLTDGIERDLSRFNVEQERIDIIKHICLIFQLDSDRATVIHANLCSEKNTIFHEVTSSVSKTPDTSKINCTVQDTSSTHERVSFNKSPSHSQMLTPENVSNSKQYTNRDGWTFVTTKNKLFSNSANQSKEYVTPVMNKFEVLGLATPTSSEDYMPIHTSTTLKKTPTKNTSLISDINFPSIPSGSYDIEQEDSMQTFFKTISKESPLKQPKLNLHSAKRIVLDETDKKRKASPLKSCAKKLLGDFQVNNTVEKTKKNLLELVTADEISESDFISNSALNSSQNEEITDIAQYIEKHVYSRGSLLSSDLEIFDLTNNVIFCIFKKIDCKFITVEDFIDFLCSKLNVSKKNVESRINEAAIETFQQEYKAGKIEKKELFDLVNPSLLLKSIFKLEENAKKLEREKKEYESLVFNKNIIHIVEERDLPVTFANCDRIQGLENCFYGKEINTKNNRNIFSIYMKIFSFKKQLLSNSDLKSDKNIRKRNKLITNILHIFGKSGEEEVANKERVDKGVQRQLKKFFTEEKNLVKETIQESKIKGLHIANKLTVEQSAYFMLETGGSYNNMRKERKILVNSGVENPFASEHSIRKFNNEILGEILRPDNIDYGAMFLNEGEGKYRRVIYAKIKDMKLYAHDYLGLIMKNDETREEFANLYSKFGKIIIPWWKYHNCWCIMSKVLLSNVSFSDITICYVCST